MEHIAIGNLAERAIGVNQIVNRIDTLQVHGQSLQTIGDLAGNRIAFNAADLLEVGELGHLHAVEPDFPTQPPGTQRGRFPVVFNKTDIVHQRINADMAQRLKVQLLNVVGIGLEHHLKLIVVLQAVGVVAVAAIGGTARRLHIGGVPGLRADGSQEGGSVKGACTHFHVVGLQHHAALLGPEALQGKDQVLKGARGGVGLVHVVDP